MHSTIKNSFRQSLSLLILSLLIPSMATSEPLHEWVKSLERPYYWGSYARRPIDLDRPGYRLWSQTHPLENVTGLADDLTSLQAYDLEHSQYLAMAIAWRIDSYRGVYTRPSSTDELEGPKFIDILNTHFPSIHKEHFLHLVEILEWEKTGKYFSLAALRGAEILVGLLARCPEEKRRELLSGAEDQIKEFVEELEKQFIEKERGAVERSKSSKQKATQRIELMRERAKVAKKIFETVSSWGISLNHRTPVATETAADTEPDQELLEQNYLEALRSADTEVSKLSLAKLLGQPVSAPTLIEARGIMQTGNFTEAERTQIGQAVTKQLMADLQSWIPKASQKGLLRCAKILQSGS